VRPSDPPTSTESVLSLTRRCRRGPVFSFTSAASPSCAGLRGATAAADVTSRESSSRRPQLEHAVPSSSSELLETCDRGGRVVVRPRPGEGIEQLLQPGPRGQPASMPCVCLKGGLSHRGVGWSPLAIRRARAPRHCIVEGRSAGVSADGLYHPAVARRALIRPRRRARNRVLLPPTRLSLSRTDCAGEGQRVTLSGGCHPPQLPF